MPKIETKKTASIGLRVEPEVKEALEVAAKAERRSVASLLEFLAVEYLVKKGFLPNG